MSTQLSFTLPYPPSVNAYWRCVIVGRWASAKLSRRARKYQESAAQRLLLQGISGVSLAGRFAVLIRAYPPSHGKHDMDNIPKGILDVLTRASVWDDDSQVDDLRVTRGHRVKGGLVAVKISVIE